MSLTVNTHLLHVIPVGDDAVLDGVLQGQDTPLALSLITYVAVLLTHTHHHTLGGRSARVALDIGGRSCYCH